MKDLLIYCSNTETLVNKVREHYPDRLGVDVVSEPVRIWDEETSEWDEYEFPVDPQPPIMERNPRFLVDKTPTVRNGMKTLAHRALSRWCGRDAVRAGIRNRCNQGAGYVGRGASRSESQGAVR